MNSTGQRRSVAGLVLAGGTSSRLGRDKARLCLHGAERGDLLRCTYDTLRTVVPHCWVSCRADQPRSGYDCLFDAEEGRGPAAGLCTALAVAAREGYGAVLTLPCDMPFMNTALLEQLLDHHAAAPAGKLMTTYVAQENSWVEALVAVYDVACLPYFQKALRQGNCTLRMIVPLDMQTWIFYPASQAKAFFNLNTLHDLVKAICLRA
ncbi:MAG: molybdenum cofactor guanylyltransferase [Desulfovibrio sp.]|nr:molybdenum cofactor guanylyltransferase [Desulfovibrio sp.]